MRHKLLVLTVKNFLQSVYIYGSYRKIKTGVPFFLDHPVHVSCINGLLGLRSSEAWLWTICRYDSMFPVKEWHKPALVNRNRTAFRGGRCRLSMVSWKYRSKSVSTNMWITPISTLATIGKLGNVRNRSSSRTIKVSNLFSKTIILILQENSLISEMVSESV